MSQPPPPPADRFELFHNPVCAVCGAGVPTGTIGNVRDHEYDDTTSLEFPVVECPDCGLVYLNPRPDVSMLGRIYTERYYSYHLAEMTSEGKAVASSWIQQLFDRINLARFRDRLFPFLPERSRSRPLKILDVGCGVGHQLDILAKLFPGAETYGVEIGAMAAGKAASRGHKVSVGRFEDVAFAEKDFDIIVTVHVIEHVAEPVNFLAKCRDLLADNGVILVETPNTDCLDFKLLRKRHWGGYHAPRHWYLFNPSSLAALARRTGLSIRGGKPYNMSVFWNWSCHSILQDVAGAKVAGLLFPPVRIYFGGLQSFVILGAFSVFERLLQLVTGKASSIWMVFAKE